MASAPIFTGVPRHERAQISTANTSRDGTGTVASVFAAGASGSRIEHIDIVAVGTVTAGVVRLFIDNGADIKLWREVLVSAVTPSGTAVGFRTSIDTSVLPTVLILKTGETLKASTHNAETFNVFATGGDF